MTFEDDLVYSITIDDVEFFTEGEDEIIVPMGALYGQVITDLPLDMAISICDSCDEDVVMLHNVPTKITRKKDDLFHVEFDELITKKYWDAPIELKLWMETKQDIISEREANLGDVRVEHYDDDGAYIHLSYSTTLSAASFEDLFNSIDAVFNEIEGATDIALGSPFERIENCKRESDFSVKVLLPLFRNLGFSNVRYNHGNREYGKDITFARRTEFDEYEFYGVQVKFGNVSGGATGDINELISQINDAFSMPFYDVYSRSRVRVSKVIIAISGKFTNNAVEKIIDGITDYPMKNNTVFLDGDKLDTFIERCRRF